MDTTITISALCAILGAVLSYAAFSRNKDTDAKKAGENHGSLMTELSYIKFNTDEIKNELKDQRRINVDHAGRIAAVEASAKQAHKRLDRIEEIQDDRRED